MAKIENTKAVTKDIKFKYASEIVIVFTLLAITCGCQSSWVKKRHQSRWIKKIGSELDSMAKGRAKFGTISFSEPILVESKRDQSSPFDFTLKTGPDDYYKDARRDVQGRMTYLDQLVKESGVGLSVQGDISALTATNVKLKQYEQELAALEAQNKLRAEARELEAQKVIAALPDDATEEQLLEAKARAAKIRAGQDTITVPDIPTSQAQPSGIATPPSSGAAEKNMTGFLGLLDKTPELKISNRSAINTAAGDTVTEAIFTLLGNPARTTQFKDKLMLFGVSMVSVSPGYVTREGYTGELSVTCRYDYRIARRDLLKKILKVEQSKKECDQDCKLIELIEKVLVPAPKSKSSKVWPGMAANKSGAGKKEDERDSESIRLIEELLVPAPTSNYSIFSTKMASKIEVGKEADLKMLPPLARFVKPDDTPSYYDPNSVIPQRYQKKYREESTPLAEAVSPMTDVDALDLSSSIRNQTFAAMKISAALSYAGLTGQAEVFDKWARKLEQDTQTRTSYAAITSFSNGPRFGFRIRPRLKAVKDGKSPGYELEDQSFPAAVIVGFDTDDLKLAFDFKRNKCGKIETDSNDMTRLVAYEPTIEFHQTINWLPNKKVSLCDKLRGNELTETRRLEWLSSYNKAKNYKELNSYFNVPSYYFDDPNYYFKKYIDNRILLLGNQILDVYSSQYLPMEFLVGKPVKKKPTVDKPSKVFYSWYDAPITCVVDGNNFEGHVVGANIGGQPCEVKVVGDKIALVTSCGWTPRPDPNTALAEKQIAQAELNIAKANKKINDAQKIIKDAGESLSKNPSDQAAIKKKKAAETDLTAARNDLADAKANKGVAEAAKRLAMVQAAMSKELQIDLITTKGSIKAGFVRFAHQATPVKAKTSSSGTSKTDPTITITRNASGKILTISSKGESEEIDKLIDIVKEGEKTDAKVDLKFNASGQMDIKADKKTK